MRTLPGFEVGGQVDGDGPAFGATGRYTRLAEDWRYRVVQARREDPMWAAVVFPVVAMVPDGERVGILIEWTGSGYTAVRVRPR